MALSLDRLMQMVSAFLTPHLKTDPANVDIRYSHNWNALVYVVPEILPTRQEGNMVIETLKANRGAVLGASLGVVAAPFLLTKASSWVDLGRYNDLIWSLGAAALAVLLVKGKSDAGAAAFAGVFLAHGVASVVPQISAL